MTRMKKCLRKISLATTIMLALTLAITAYSSGAELKFKYVTSIYSDDNNIPLKQPEGVACDGKSLLLLADTGNARLLRYIFNDGFLEAEIVEIKSPQLFYPVKTEINSRGEIYILDRKQRRIVRLSSGGEFQGYLNPAGLPSPAVFVPRSFTIDKDDNIYILDILSERVLILDPGGKYLGQIKLPQKYGSFSDIAVDLKGTVLLVDGVNGVIFSAAINSPAFSALTGSLKQYARFPASLTTDDRGRIYVVDRNGGSIIILGQDGAFVERQSGPGWKEGQLNYPAQICINTKGEIFVADTRNNRVQVFALIE
jgi:hypothetical protein